AADAVAAARFLRTRPGIDPARVGLFAVSQGGWIAPVAAARLGDVRFVVTVSASLTTIADDNLFERSARLRREGFGESDVAAARAMHLVDNDVSRGHGGFEQFVRLWEEHKGSRWFRRVYGDPQPSPPDSPYRAWYRTVMDRDPVADWARLTAPALFIFGDPALDEFSPVAQSVARVDSLAAAGRPFERLIVAGADHNLRRNGADVDLATPLSAWLARALAAP
ncbi:MAG: hypothetical protein HY275_14925, partial [Gemmatimonadetes bacterium]|nr:hypothetical protein [Gemmatimonadota bacterium]